MKLLIVTQKVDENDDVLGFFISWIKEFAKHCEQVELICLFEGEHNLSANVRVHSLGKERGASKLTQLATFFYFKFFLKYDAVFVHMNPIYVCLAGDWWRLTRKRVGLFYTHRHVDFKLKMAEKFANFIFTASESSFQLKTKKLRVVGHGIEVERFRNPGILPVKGLVLSVGRISPIKHQDVLINALRILREKSVDVRVKFVGAPGSLADNEYDVRLREIVEEHKLGDFVEFAGSMPNKLIAKEYWNAAVSVNLLPMGGLDKAVFESLAAGTPTVTTNQGFKQLALPGLVLCELDIDEVAKAIQIALVYPPQVDSDKISREYSSEQVVSKILAHYE